MNDLDGSDEYAVRESNHLMDSFSKRTGDVNSEMVYDCLFNRYPVLIGKSSYNRFKVVYEHPTRSSQDIYIIIEVAESENILIVTVYIHTNERRIRTHDR